MKSCVFCQIVQDKAPCHKVWEDVTHLAFLSIYPNTRGLTVVIPKQHLGSYLFDQEERDIHALMQASRAVSQILVAKLPEVERVAIVFEGYGVDHLHAKLFPLHGAPKQWKPSHTKLSTTYTQYPGYISTHDADRASDATLAQLAARLRGKDL